jgi:3-oxoadipate enol-lactonase
MGFLVLKRKNGNFCAEIIDLIFLRSIILFTALNKRNTYLLTCKSFQLKSLMPKVQLNDCQYHYEFYQNPHAKETILFSHGLLWSGKMFDKQVLHLKNRYNILTYDHRGQGRSEVTENGYDMDVLYEDVVALIETLELGPIHFVGLSMGGFVGMRLAARKPELVRSLSLLETSAQAEPNKLKYRLLCGIVLLFGVNIVTNPVMKIMFGDTFLNDPERAEEKAKWVAELQKNQKSIVRAVYGVIGRQGLESELNEIKCPVLILVGTEDKATVPAKSEYIHQQIPHSELHYIPRAGHTSSVEEGAAVNERLDAFLCKITELT